MLKLKMRHDYYQKVETDENGNGKIPDKIYGMYHVTINKDYFNNDQHKVLGMVIKDMEELLKKMKEKYRKDEKILDSWDSIEK